MDNKVDLKICYDDEAKKYFNSLPKHLQETMVQGGISFCSKKDLEQYVTQLTGKNQTIGGNRNDEQM